MTSTEVGVRRVFLCDDQFEMRQALTAVITAIPGFAVVGVGEDGDQCREGLRAEDVDVLVVDVSMPGGGAELVAAVRAEHPDLVIISFSAHSEPEVREAMLAAGADVFVLKTGRLAPLREALLQHSPVVE